MADISEKMMEIQESASNWRLLVSTALLLVHGLGHGAAYVYGSLILPHQLQNGSRANFLQLTEEQGSWSVGITPLGAIVGTLAGSHLGELSGRKLVIILSNIMEIIGYSIIYFGDSFALFMLGRCVTCFGAGFGVMMPYILISELSTIKWRGALIQTFNVGASYGIFIAYLLVLIIDIQYLIHILVLVHVFILLLSPLIPESPHWLIRNCQTEKAELVYSILRGTKYKGIAEEIEEVKFCISSQKESSFALSMKRRMSSSFLHPLSIIMFLYLFVALNGVDAIMLYGPVIFQEVGQNIPPLMISALVPLGQSVGYTLVFPLMSRINRRTHYVSTCAIMSSSCFLLCSAIYLLQLPSSVIPGSVCQIAMAVSAFMIPLGYGLGNGAVTYTVPGELLSPDDKALGFTVGQSMRMIGTFVVVKIYPTLVRHFGLPAIFGCHGAMTVLAAIFCWRCLPETRNKSIKEIHMYFNK